jgi:hypothetical protein
LLHPNILVIEVSCRYLVTFTGHLRYETRVAILERHLKTMELIEKAGAGENLLEDAIERQTFDYLFAEFPEFAKSFDEGKHYHDTSNGQKPKNFLGKLFNYVSRQTLPLRNS